MQYKSCHTVQGRDATRVFNEEEEVRVFLLSHRRGATGARASFMHPVLWLSGLMVKLGAARAASGRACCSRALPFEPGGALLQA